MSVRGDKVEQKRRSKNPFEPDPKGHDESIRSLSSHKSQAENRWKRLLHYEEIAELAFSKLQHRLEYFKAKAETDPKAKEDVIYTKGEIHMWKIKLEEIRQLLKDAEKKMYQLIGSPEKPKKNKSYIKLSSYTSRSNR